MILILALVFALLAGLLHIGIFIMESVLWRRPAVWHRFGLDNQADADTNALLAYNQGFYSLFLALGALAGVLSVAFGARITGWTLLVFTCSSMVAAAAVLHSSGRHYTRSALIQATCPALALVCAAVLALGA